jgi:serine/threonine protein kinase
MTGSSGRCQVVRVIYYSCLMTHLKVHKSLCELCTATDSKGGLCKNQYIAKFIPNTSLVGINEEVILQLLREPIPHAVVVYHQKESDKEGSIILMDEHQSTLREAINRVFKSKSPLSGWTEHDCVIITLGILKCLVEVHDRGLVHGDLKPSNSLPS